MTVGSQDSGKRSHHCGAWVWIVTEQRALKSGILAKICLMKFRKTFIALSFINAILLTIIFISPYWMVHYCIGGETIVGLWTFCYLSRCMTPFAGTANMEAARALMIIALGSAFTALITLWDLLTHFLKRKVPELLISSAANYLEGVCLFSSMVIVYSTHLMVGEKEIMHLTPDWAFCIGCVTCSLSIILGTFKYMQHKYQRTRVMPLMRSELSLCDPLEPPL
ncbi:uncharacterized protein LOC128333107 [Hemicordylus capensis]|uniref:uncharacterized protein LOC128333107 n=1 Tax=Hemicordylus capensis TaxID=884348 RepID=UPI0023043FE2|nr:uncharacterized protein LOC128333107 [Hemicordylus capensis]